MPQLLLLMALLLAPTFSASNTSSKTNNKKPKKEYPDYIYGAISPAILEFNRTADPTPEHPAFLFGANQGPRVVQFYSPQCPHCRSFRDTYLELADQVNQIAREQGVTETVEFHAISCRPNHALCKQFGIKFFPHFLLFVANATAESTTSSATATARKTTTTKTPATSNRAYQEFSLEELHPLYILETFSLHNGQLSSQG